MPEITGKDIYNHERYYTSTLLPKIRELQVLCTSKHMPMFITVAVKNDETETKYNSEMVLGTSGTDLLDNRIAKLVLYLNDFKTNIPENVQDAIQTIREYVKQLEISKIDAGETDITLYKDMIQTMNRIVNNGETIEFPKGTFHQDADKMSMDGMDDFIMDSM